MKKKMVIVGNADVRTDRSFTVDQADVVVRFNHCNNRNKGTGSKTDILCLNYDGLKHIDVDNNVEVLITEPCHSILYNLFRRVLIYVYLIIGVGYFQGLRKRAEYEKLIRAKGLLNASMVDHNTYRAARRKIRNGSLWDFRQPSSGFVAIEKFVREHYHDRYQIAVIGFTWQGFDCHHWEVEKLIMEDYAARGIVTILADE